MDEIAVRAQLGEVQDELKRNQEEREMLLTVARGFEAWLRLRGRSVRATPIEPKVGAADTDVAKTDATNRPAGTISMRAAVLQVLQDAHGEPLSTDEILARARRMGAETRSARAASIVDLIAATLRNRYQQPVERVQPKVWRWAVPSVTTPIDGIV